MVSRHIQAAIVALLATDENATDEERTAVAAATSGQWRALTIKEAARRLGCQRPKLYRLIREGMLATTPDGRISELEISRFLSAGAVTERRAV